MAAMTQGDWNSTIDRLVAATADAREVIAEAHGATRDLRQAVADTRELLARTVPEAVEQQVNDRVSEVVSESVEALATQTRKAIDDAVAKVGREFTRLERIYLGTDQEAVRKGALPLEDAIRRSRPMPGIPDAFRKERP